MATKTYFLKNTAVNGFGSLSETDPGASTMTTGWVVAKIASGNFSALLFNTERLSGTFSTTDYLVTTHPNPGSGDSWRSENTINGTFANANWTFTFAVRAVTAASTQLGRVKFRLWRSANADGSAATEITSATQSCSIMSPGASTTVDSITSLVFNPGAVTLTNEYLFVQCEWNITTAGGSNSADIDFRASASTVVTSDFTPATQGLTPSLFTNSQTFPAATVGSTYDLTPGLFTNTNTFFNATVSSTYDLTPGLFTNSNTFFTPQVDLVIFPGLFTDSQTFFSPTVAQPGTGDQNLAPALYTNTQTFFTPTVTATYDLLPGLYANSQTFFSSTITATYELSPSLFSNSQTFFSATVAQPGGGTQSIFPPLFVNENIFELGDPDFFFSPTVTLGEAGGGELPHNLPILVTMGPLKSF